MKRGTIKKCCKVMAKIFLYLAILFFFTARAEAQLLYNTTNLTNADNPYDMAVALNDVVDGFVGYAILAITFFIPFIVLNQNTQNAVSAFGGSIFFTAVIATIMLPLNMISLGIYNIIVLLTAISVMVSLWLNTRS